MHNLIREISYLCLATCQFELKFFHCTSNTFAHCTSYWATITIYNVAGTCTCNLYSIYTMQIHSQLCLAEFIIANKQYSVPSLNQTAPYLMTKNCVQNDEFVQITEGLLNKCLNKYRDNLYIMHSI